jgi:hypothetical protein
MKTSCLTLVYTCCNLATDMKIFTSIDAFILSCFQAAADMIQSWIGVNNFTVARILACVYTIGSVMQMVVQQSFVLLIPDVGMVLVLVSQILTGEQSIRSSSGLTTSNILETWVFFRMTVMLFYIALTPAVALLEPVEACCVYVQYISFITCYYFAACTPKPPSKSKLRKMLTSLGRAVRSLVPTPEPCPVQVRL